MRTLVRLISVAAMAAAPLWTAHLSRATEFHVASDGRPDGDGSAARPWDLAAAFSAPPALRPGDTIWLDGGTYNGAIVCRLQGTAEAPITVRARPGQRVTLDCGLGPVDRERLLVVENPHVVLWGLEVTCSDPKRRTEIAGSWPADINRGGIHCRAGHVKLVNLVVHDCGGIGFWSEGEGGEVYGSLIYHNGWKGPDRGHGHGIYAQNRAGEKRLADNVIFNHFGDGIHVYGSEKAALVGFRIEGNALFNNGCLNGPGERTRNLLVGGGSPADRITLAVNCTYHSDVSATSVQLGYASPNESGEVRGNYLVGYTRVLDWRRLVFRGNTLVGLGTLASFELSEGNAPNGALWDENEYLGAQERYSPLVLRQGDRTLALDYSGWQAAGLDAHGRYAPGEITGLRVFVRPNQYEPGRANVIVYNWDHLEDVAVELDGVLRLGQAYRVVRAQDFFGEPVAAGRFDGQPLRLPMKPLPAAPPVGLEDIELPVTAPQFDVFVVLPEAES